MLKLYNTLTRKKEVFKPISKKEVGMYTCGPTVYDYAHIGNYRAYIVADILKRSLRYNGFKVKHVMNITDVEDKTIKESQKAKVSLKNFTRKYEKEFMIDLEKLNIEKASIFPRATEHIKDMVKAIKKLINNKFAYKGADGSIYYSISKFKDYGKLSHTKLKKLKAGARVKQDEYTKEAASDFALWKAWDKADGDVFWETEIGKGRPGWHIECSVMSSKYLGNQFDIHTGGTDLVFPHHENEIAQAEPISEKKPFVKYWIHNEWLLVDGKKMSKSLGNFYTLRDLIKKTYFPMHFRYLCLLTHYRKSLNFTFKNLDSAKATLERIKRKIIELRKNKQGKKDLTKKYQKEFEKAINDDLNTPQAVQVFLEALDDENFNSKKKLSLLEKFDSILGVPLGLKRY